MLTRLTRFLCGAAALLLAASVSLAQVTSEAVAPLSAPVDTAPAASATNVAVKSTSAGVSDGTSMMLVQAATATVPPATNTPGTTGGAVETTTTSAVDPEATGGDAGGVGVREFQGDDVGQVLRLLARQAKINMVVSDQLPPGTTVTMRLEDVTALQAIAIIVKAKGLFMDRIDNVYYIKTGAERTAEPTESDSYQFSFAQLAVSDDAAAGEVKSTLGTAGAISDLKNSISVKTKPNEDLLKLIKSQLQSGVEPQFDLRTNTVYYRETTSNIENFRKTLRDIDKPTKQVMIEARLVEVSANPRQSFGINWAGVVGSADSPQRLSYGTNAGGFTLPSSNNNIIGNFGNLGAGTFAILSAPQMSVTLQALNEDNDTEFLANPRVVTANNMPAKIEIVRAQPVPTLSFNEQTAQSVFNGFVDKTFGNTLLVKPSVNKENFITLAVKPIISNKVSDQTFRFVGAEVQSPVIDTRSLDSNVLIKSGDTLAIGGLLQDESNKARTKVPIMGDVPVLGYLFQSRTNSRVKRNLLVFVTPTVIDQHYGTGLEDQVSGLRNVGEEFADPNGWRNNAKGAVRLVPTSRRQVAADYPKPGVPPAPARTNSNSRVRFMTDAKDRDY
jgi:type IV pilus secretin PilQ/predicted competence protein